MSLPRPTSDEARRQLKSATRLAVKQLGGQDVVSSFTRVGQQTLSDCGNVSNARHEQTFVALDVALDLIVDAKDQGVVSPLLQEICRQAGGAFVPTPTAPRSAAHWHGELSTAVKEGGEAAAKICSALADDGMVSPKEIRDGDIIRELNEAVEA
ncbi:hypothetical protein, partial [Roseibium polysiphoniae]